MPYDWFAIIKIPATILLKSFTPAMPYEPLATSTVCQYPVLQTLHKTPNLQTDFLDKKTDIPTIAHIKINA